VRDFVSLSFEHAGLDWEKYVRFDERYLRPTEVDTLVADATMAEKTLKWKATVHPKQLAALMVDHDIATLGGYIPDKPVGEVWLEAAS
jgi:GDPmannose 4,6-dehydratase